MKITLKNKIFKLHKKGLWIAKDGEVYVPMSGAHKEHFTYGSTNSRGYKQVRYKRKFYLVHKLVGECFLPNPDNLQTIDHIDRNKENNSVENLRWASYSLQNINQNHPKNNAKSKKVLQYTLDGQLVREWPSTAECGRNGFDNGNISACCRGKYKHYKGYIWKYKN